MKAVFFLNQSGHGGGDKIPPFSIFQLENILRSSSNLSTSYGCLTDLESF